MATALELRVRGLDAATANVAGLPDRLHAALLATVQRETLELQRHVVEDKLSGQVLHARTGTGRRSITQVVTDGPGLIRGSVGTSLGYMLAHEFGMTLHIPEIVPVKAKALHWIAKGGGSVFAMRTRAHDVKLPERSFLRSALADRQVPFVAAVQATIKRILGSKPQ